MSFFCELDSLGMFHVDGDSFLAVVAFQVHGELPAPPMLRAAQRAARFDGNDFGPMFRH
jgi:hypothetical protein